MSNGSSSDVAADPALEAAVKLHQAGKIDRAANAYRQILERDSDHPNALHLLGVTELQSGHFDEAAALISRAIAIQPNTGVYHVNLAAALRAMRRIDDAIAEAEKAIVLDANLAAQGYHIAALAFADGGQPLDAIDCWVKALAARPEFAEAHLSIAMLMDGMGKYYYAITQQEHAERVSREWVAREPDSAPARMLLGRSLEQGGKLDEAVAEYRETIKLLPHDANAFLALGRVLRRQGQYEEALASLRFAARMNPTLADAHAALGGLLLEQGRVADATASLRAALALMANHTEARATLADALAQAGEVEQAVEEARRAVEAEPTSAAARSTLLRTLLLDARVTPQELAREHAEWDKVHGAAMRFAVDEHVKWERRMARQFEDEMHSPEVDRRPDRPLRIGFVSPHFARHPLAKTLIPLLEQLDRARFAVFCYSDVPVADDVTDDFKKLAHAWRDTTGLSDTQFALLVRSDQIDVLVDLTGHGRGNRLPAFGQQPAPVQVTQIGYPFTTGLSAIAHRVSDDVADPPGDGSDALHSERLVRLPRPAVCFRPWERTPARLEARPTSGPITFGAFAAEAAHLTPATIDLWARAMAATPDSRLLVMSPLPDAEAIRARLVKHGIESARLTVAPHADGARYLDLFNQVDIALDTFPHSGGTIAGDAVWMGTPMVTLAAAAAPASRGAAVFLHSVGLGDLVASSPQQFVDVAAALAADRARLEQLNLTLRETLLRSSVCDARACAAAMMDFYRDAWRQYCQAPAERDDAAARA